MKSILGFFQQQSSDSSSDIKSEEPKVNLNTVEVISMESGSHLFNQSNETLTVTQKRTQMIAYQSVTKILNHKHFSICDLDTLMDLVGRGRVNSKVYKQLRALHCVNYTDMPEELVAQIPYMINELLTNKIKPSVEADIALNGLF